MEDNTFGWNLRKLRTDYEMTQGYLAAATGISQKTISSYEKGRTEPSMGDATKIARVLNCSLDRLAGNKARSVGDISYEDVLVKLSDLSLDELKELGRLTADMYDQKCQLLQIEKMEAEQKKRYAAYERRIRELAGKRAGDSK